MRTAGWSEETYNKEDLCITKVHYGINRPPILSNEGCYAEWEPDLEILPIDTDRSIIPRRIQELSKNTEPYSEWSKETRLWLAAEVQRRSIFSMNETDTYDQRVQELNSQAVSIVQQRTPATESESSSSSRRPPLIDDMTRSLITHNTSRQCAGSGRIPVCLLFVWGCQVLFGCCLGVVCFGVACPHSRLCGLIHQTGIV